MEILKTLHDAIDGIGKMPGIYGARKARYDRKFETSTDLNLFRGLFKSFEEAAAAAAVPAVKPVGYDNEGPALMYSERTIQIYVSDYPVLYWLSKLFSEGCTRVFDVGGHIGVGYYAYQKYIQFPSEIQWCVFDVPAVVRRGQDLAIAWDKLNRLTLTSEFNKAEDSEVIFASGSIQYLPTTLKDLLSGLQRKPKYLVVNLLPIHSRETYYTVQTIGSAFCPYRIESHFSFTRGLAEIGYELLDHWENLDKGCEIPFVDPMYSLDRYHGFCFRLSTS